MKNGNKNKIEYNKVLINGFFLLLVAVIGLVGVWLKAMLDKKDERINKPLMDTIQKINPVIPKINPVIPKINPDTSIPTKIKKWSPNNKIPNAEQAAQASTIVKITFNGKGTMLKIDGKDFSLSDAMHGVSLTIGTHIFEVIGLEHSCRIEKTITKSTPEFDILCN